MVSVLKLLTEQTVFVMSVSQQAQLGSENAPSSGHTRLGHVI